MKIIEKTEIDPQNHIIIKMRVRIKRFAAS